MYLFVVNITYKRLCNCFCGNSITLLTVSNYYRDLLNYQQIKNILFVFLMYVFSVQNYLKQVLRGKKLNLNKYVYIIFKKTIFIHCIHNDTKHDFKD